MQCWFDFDKFIRGFKVIDDKVEFISAIIILNIFAFMLVLPIADCGK